MLLLKRCEKQSMFMLSMRREIIKGKEKNGKPRINSRQGAQGVI